MLDKAAGDVDKLSGAQKRQIDTSKETETRSRALRKEFDEFSASVKRGEKSTDDAVFGLRRMAQEMDKLARKRPIGDVLGEDLNRASQAARRMVAEINDVGRAEEAQAKARAKATQQEIGDRGKVLESRLREQQSNRALRTEIERLVNSYESFHISVERGERSSAQARAGYKQFASELGSLQRKFEAGSDESLRLGERVEEARGHADRFTASLRRTGSAADQVHTRLGRMFNIDTSKLERIDQRIEDFNRSLSRGRFSVAAFDNRLRGLILVGAFAFFQQLVGVAGALAGALVSVASAAGQAAGALAGLAAAGAAQAVPVIGLVAAAWGRVGAVFKAVQQAQKQQVQSAYDNAQANDRQRQAADQVRGAQEGLAQAHQRVADAQDALNKARADGVRQLEDLIAAERRAELQAEEARRTLSTSIATGDIDSQAQDELALSDALRSRGRARTDARAAVAGGVGGLETVQAASRALADARKGVVDARRAADEANKSAAETVKQMGTADRLLQQMLGQLSPAERRLYTALRGLQKTYHDVFIGDGRRSGILGTIINAFTYGADRAKELLGDRGILSAAKGLSNGIASEIKRGFGGLTSGENVSFFEEMADEARKNLPLVSDIIGNLFKTFRNFARAASPAFHTFLEFLRELTGEASNTGLDRLEAFFNKGEHYAESIIKLGQAIGGLFLAVIGQSAEEGNSAIDSLTAKINEATAWINTHQKDVQQFFRDAREATGYVMHAVFELTKALFSLFHPDQVKVFSQAFERFLLPALLNVAHVMGTITGIFLKFASTGAGSALLQMGLASLLLFKSISPLIALFSRLIVVMGTLAGSERLVVAGLTLLEVATGPIGIALAVITATILLLHDRLKDLPDVLKLVAAALAGIAVYFIGTKGLAGPLKAVFGLFDGIAAAGLAGRFGAIGAALGGILSTVLGLIRKLPGLNKLLAETAAAETAAGGAGTGGAGARAAAGASARRRRNLARGAGALALFGASQAIGRPGGLPTGNEGVLGEANIIGSNFVSNLTSLNVGGAVKNLFGGRHELEEFSKSFQENFKKLQLQHNAEGLRDLADKARKLSGEWPQFADQLNKAADASDKAAQHFVDVRKAMARLGTAADEFRGHQLKAEDIINPNAIAQFLSNLQRMKAMGFTSVKDLRSDIAFNLKQIQTGFAEGSHSWAKAMQDNFRRAIRSLQEAMDDGKLSVKNGTREMHHIANQNLRQLRDDMGTLSAEGKQALANNAIGAANAMERQMKRAGKVTEEGMKRVRDLMTEALVNGYGFTQEQALNIAKTGDISGRATPGKDDPSRGMAIGGFVGQQGERGKDIIRTTLGRGEAVLNWAHQKYIEPAVNWFYGHGLGDVFKRVRGFHAGGPEQEGFSGGYAGRSPSGRMEVPIPGFSGEFGEKSVVGKMSDFAHKFRMLLTDGFATAGHVGRGHLFYGNAADYVPGGGGSWDLVDKAAQYAVNMRKIFGSVLYDGRFGTTAWPGHGRPEFGGTHLHVEFNMDGGGEITGGGATGEMSKKVARAIRQIRNLKVGGPASLLRGGVQASIDRIGQAANFRIRQAASLSSGDVESMGVGGDAQKNLSIGKRMARAMGWIGAQWDALRQLWMGESGWRKNARNPSSGAFGIPQALPASKMASAGQDWMTSAGTQIKWGLKYIADRYGSPLAALRSWLSRSPHWYSAGGDVPGSGPAPIVAHGGEHIWTAEEVQRAGGHGVMRLLRRMLGGGLQGGPISFKDGGAPDPTKVFGSGRYSLPTIYDITIGGLTREAREAQGFLRRLSLKSKEFLKSFQSAFRPLAGEGGLLDQLQQAITDFVDKMATNLTAATYKMNRAGDIVEKIDAVGVADRKVGNLYKVNAALTGERGVIAKSLDGVADRIDALRKGGIKKDERKTYEYLVGYRRALQKRLDAVRSDIASNLSSIYQSVEDAIQARVDKASTAAGRITSQVDLAQRARQIVGGTVASALGFPTNTALGQQRSGALTAQADSVQAAANLARQRGHGDTAKTLMQTVQDLRLQALEAIQTGISSDVDEVNRQAQRKSTGLDLKNRVASALGQKDVISNIFTDRIANARDQIDKLREQQRAAGQNGLGALSEQIQDQIDDLNTSITELASQRLDAMIASIDDQASRQSTTFSLRNRMADLIGKSGNSVGAAKAVTAALYQQAGDLQSQISGYSNALMEAIKLGDTGHIADLQAKISELQVAIAENTQAIRDSPVRERQALIDLITGRGAFQGGVFGNLNTLVTALGAISGGPDVGTQKGLIGQVITTLQETGTGLRQQLLEGYGVNTVGSNPGELVNILRSLNYDGIEASFDEAEKSQFEALINAVIENAIAVAQNTDQLNQLNNPSLQTWSSTAWKWFRNAIFTGAGGLLPQYQIPSLAGGASILSDGMVHVHAGEKVVAAEIARGAMQEPGVFAPHFDVTEQVEEADVDVMANRMLWRWKTRPKGTG